MFKLAVLLAVACVCIAAPVYESSDSHSHSHGHGDHGQSHGNSNPNDVNAETRSLTNEIKEDGSYNYQFDTTNGITAQENGVGGHFATGSSQYYSPEGHLIQLSYTADENGFQPHGDHLPTPPPIPEEILKALEYIRQHPEENEDEGAYEHDHHDHHGDHGSQYGAAAPPPSATYLQPHAPQQPSNQYLQPHRFSKL